MKRVKDNKDKGLNINLDLETAEKLSMLMDGFNDTNIPESLRVANYLMLLDIKQEMIDKEHFELLKEFKKLEDLHACPITFKDLKGDIVLVK